MRHLFFSILSCLLIFCSCDKDVVQDHLSQKQSHNVDSRTFFQKYLNSKTDNLSARDGNVYSIDQYISLVNDAINYNYSFAHLPSGPLENFTDEIEFSSNVISESEGNSILDQIICKAYDRYASLENQNADLIQFNLERTSNVLPNGRFKGIITTFFRNAPQHISNTFVSGSCTGEGPFCMHLFYKDSNFDPTCPGDASKALEQEINTRLRDPNPRVYYTNLDFTCAKGPNGRSCYPSTGQSIKFQHDVTNQDDPIPNDNSVDYRVFHSDGYNYQDGACIPYKDLNCYMAWAFQPISTQYNPPGKVFHLVSISNWLLLSIPGSIGHSMTLVYGEKKTRLIGDTPSKLDNSICAQ